MPEILVRGHSEAMLAPSDAAVTVTVHIRTAQTQAEAITACARRCEQVDAEVDARTGSLVRRAVTSSIRTGPEWEHNPKAGRRLVGHFATRTTELDCAPDGALLTSLLSDVGAMPDVRINGPRWRVAPDAPGWEDVRSAAAADARSRAEAYAGGLGLTVGRIVWLAEPGLRRGGSGGVGGGGGEATMAFAAAPAMRRGGAGVEEEESAAVRIQPEPITVEVTVEAAFDLE